MRVPLIIITTLADFTALAPATQYSLLSPTGADFSEARLQQACLQDDVLRVFSVLSKVQGADKPSEGKNKSTI